jgi:hypothetical protein
MYQNNSLYAETKFDYIIPQEAYSDNFTLNYSAEIRWMELDQINEWSQWFLINNDNDEIWLKFD